MEIDRKYRSSQIYEIYNSKNNVAKIDYNYKDNEYYTLKVKKTPADIERIPIKIQKYVKDENGNLIIGNVSHATVVVCT